METKTATAPKILVIDDEVAILHAMGIYLEQEGYSVEAISKFDHYLFSMNQPTLPDIIILDIFLNQENGAEIAKELKSNSKTKHIPIIMISALPEGRKLAKEAGADAFLAKPFDLKELNDKIEELTGKQVTKGYYH